MVRVGREEGEGGGSCLVQSFFSVCREGVVW